MSRVHYSTFSDMCAYDLCQNKHKLILKFYNANIKNAKTLQWIKIKFFEGNLIIIICNSLKENIV